MQLRVPAALPCHRFDCFHMTEKDKHVEGLFFFPCQPLSLHLLLKELLKSQPHTETEILCPFPKYFLVKTCTAQNRKMRRG